MKKAMCNSNYYIILIVTVQCFRKYYIIHSKTLITIITNLLTHIIDIHKIYLNTYSYNFLRHLIWNICELYVSKKEMENTQNLLYLSQKLYIYAFTHNVVTYYFCIAF